MSCLSCRYIWDDLQIIPGEQTVCVGFFAEVINGLFLGEWVGGVLSIGMFYPFTTRKVYLCEVMCGLVLCGLFRSRFLSAILLWNYLIADKDAGVSLWYTYL